MRILQLPVLQLDGRRNGVNGLELTLYTPMSELRRAELPEHLETHVDEDPYTAWQEQEGVKVIVDYKCEDLNRVALGLWARKGGGGAIFQIPHPFYSDPAVRNPILTNDLHVVEIDPDGASVPEHHLYEEITYILSGRGTTSIWQEPTQKHIVEWEAGSLLTIPLNAWYQHFNASGTEAVRYASMTNAPPVMRTFKNLDFVLNNPYQFSDRFSSQEEGYFSGEGQLLQGARKSFSTIYRTNFVPNADTMPLWEYSARGASGINTHFRLAQNVSIAHLSEFPVGTYKKGHAHEPGPHLIILGGVGFSLLWNPGDRVKERVDWKRGSLVTIPGAGVLHQHFNTGTEPARYLAMYAPPSTVDMSGGDKKPPVQGDFQIEYEDEDRDIHELFEAELARNGAHCKMERFVPWCTHQSTE